MLDPAQLIIVGGNGHHDLDRGIISALNGLLNTKLGFSHLNIDIFPDQESDFRFLGWRKKLPGRHVICFQSMLTDTEHSGEHYGWEFLQMIWALKQQYHAKSVTAVVPFMLYRRQDHPEKEEEIHRNLMFLQMLKFAGADRLILCDIHSQQTIRNCEQIGLPVWNADPTALFAAQLRPFVANAHREQRQFFVFAPDGGSVARATALGKALGVKVAVSFKSRAHSGEITMVEDQTVWEKLQQEYGDLLFLADDSLRQADVCTRDDEITTGNTATKTAARLKTELGVHQLFGCFSHPVCVPGWKRVLVDSGLFDRILFGNTGYRGYEKSTGGEVLTVDLSPAIAETLFQMITDME